MPLAELPHPSFHRSWIEVDLAAIEENTRRFLRLVGPGVQLMPEVKADAYGHGAVMCGRTMLAAGAARLAVATCQEGEELRAAGIEAPVHILGASLPEEVKPALACDLTLSVHETGIAELVSLEAVRQGKTARIHLKIDTGMGRLGFLPEEAPSAAAAIAALPNVELEALFMHFADAGDEAYCRQQLSRFHDACRILDAAGVCVPLRHAASSAAAILYPEARFDMIRPGAAVYGFHSPPWLAQRFPVLPALAWKCVVIQLKDYPAGSSLGYNRTFTTRRPTRVAVLPVGYADGYLRAFSNRADVLIHGRRVPVVGMISMDYAMADVTDLPDVQLGGEVTLIGRDGGECIRVEELAEHADTIPYCIPAALGRRPGRCYVRSRDAVAVAGPDST